MKCFVRQRRMLPCQTTCSPPGTLSEKSFADTLGSSLYIYRLFLICKIDEEIIYNYLDTVTG